MTTLVSLVVAAVSVDNIEQVAKLRDNCRYIKSKLELMQGHEYGVSRIAGTIRKTDDMIDACTAYLEKLNEIVFACQTLDSLLGQITDLNEAIVEDVTNAAQVTDRQDNRGLHH